MIKTVIERWRSVWNIAFQCKNNQYKVYAVEIVREKMQHKENIFPGFNLFKEFCDC